MGSFLDSNFSFDVVTESPWDDGQQTTLQFYLARTFGDIALTDHVVERLLAASLSAVARYVSTNTYPAFSITVANEALRFSTISRVTSNSFNFFWLGRLNIRSSMSSSRIMRSPRAPTLRAIA